MKLKLEIPDYISIENFQKLSSLEHLGDFEKLIETIHIFTGINKDEIGTWDIDSISQITKDLTKPIEADDAFYPIIEFNDVLYGYASIKKMTLGEYIDLERLCKEPRENMAEIAAILYRPVKKHNFKKLSFHIKNGLKVAKNKTENIFKHYTIEDYSVEDRDARAEEFKHLPVQYLNGALSFFLAAANNSLISTHPSLNQEEKKTMRMYQISLLSHLANIGDGLVPYINYRKPLSLKSQVTKVLPV